MSLWEPLSAVLMLGALFFFLAGTLGLLRFPDVYVRVHALTKADNVGLGLLVLALLLRVDSVSASLKLVLIWLLVLLAGAVAAHLVARTACEGRMTPDSPGADEK